MIEKIVKVLILITYLILSILSILEIIFFSKFYCIIFQITIITPCFIFLYIAFSMINITD